MFRTLEVWLVWKEKWPKIITIAAPAAPDQFHMWLMDLFIKEFGRIAAPFSIPKLLLPFPIGPKEGNEGYYPIYKNA